ncbi:MAG: DUF4160 domain-containing protein [Candidatus Dormibacteria bacterium]
MKAGPIRSPWESPGFLLWHATLRWQRATAAALRPLGITHVQFVLLASTWWLGENGEAPSQRQLAEHCGTDPMMTSQVARTLEAKGLLTRDADPADCRVRRMRVTAAGRQLALTAIAVVEAADQAYFAQVADQPALGRLLKTLAVPPGASQGEGRRSDRFLQASESRRYCLRSGAVADRPIGASHGRVGAMPRISSFYGIVIAMFFDERTHPGRPHFHATYGGQDVSIDINSLEMLAGIISPSGLRLLREWAGLHRDELLENWERARRGEPLQQIDPLP